MKYEYVEGGKALENFESGMKAMFTVPKHKSQSAKKRTPKKSSVRKMKRSDRD